MRGGSAQPRFLIHPPECLDPDHKAEQVWPLRCLGDAGYELIELGCGCPTLLNNSLAEADLA